jgi:CheY-like chemotaxis protein
MLCGRNSWAYAHEVSTRRRRRIVCAPSVERVLVDARLRVRSVANDSEALALLMSEKSGVIVPDVIMRVMDGRLLLRHARDAGLISSVPILAAMPG